MDQQGSEHAGRGARAQGATRDGVARSIRVGSEDDCWVDGDTVGLGGDGARGLHEGDEHAPLGIPSTPHVHYDDPVLGWHSLFFGMDVDCDVRPRRLASARPRSQGFRGRTRRPHPRSRTQRCRARERRRDREDVKTPLWNSRALQAPVHTPLGAPERRETRDQSATRTAWWASTQPKRPRALNPLSTKRHSGKDTPGKRESGGLVIGKAPGQMGDWVGGWVVEKKRTECLGW